MGLRSHEYEDTKTNPAPLSVGIKKRGTPHQEHPTQTHTDAHTHMRMRTYIKIGVVVG